jgi:hypothetical protein
MCLLQLDEKHPDRLVTDFKYGDYLARCLAKELAVVCQIPLWSWVAMEGCGLVSCATDDILYFRLVITAGSFCFTSFGGWFAKQILTVFYGCGSDLVGHSYYLAP